MVKEIQILNNGESLHSIRTKINENFVGLNQAENIEYDPIETGLLADNVQTAIDSLGRRINGLNKFCVNEGNLTNEVEDLLGYVDSNLQFKVGGNYPNIIATKADGTTFTRSIIPNSSVTGLSNGNYNVFINENFTEILNNNILSVGQEDLAVNGDILYNSSTNEAKKYETTGLAVKDMNVDTTTNFRDIATNGNLYVCCGVSGTIVTSTNLTNWTQRVGNTDMQMTRIIYTGTSFVTVGQYAAIWRSTDGISWTRIRQGVSGTHNSYIALASGGGKLVATGSGMFCSISTDDGVTWQDTTIANINDMVRGLVYANGEFVGVTAYGKLIRSINGIDWTVEQINPNYDFYDIIYENGKFFICGSRGLLGYGEDPSNLTFTSPNNSVTFNACGYANGFYYAVGVAGAMFISNDLKTWSQLATGTNRQFHGCLNDVIIAEALVCKLEPASTWTIYDKIPVGSVTVSNGTITGVETFPYNYTQYNGLLATSSTFGLMRVAAPEDEVDCSCNDASITPANLYNISNYRRANTEYEVGDSVACPYHHNIQLVCSTAGTTSNGILNTLDGLYPGTKVTDGTVEWLVQELGGSGGSGGMGMPIGTIFQAIREDIPANCLRLDGTEYTEGFESFVINYLKTGKITSKTFDEWQTEYTMTDGNVGFFGYDEATGAFKTPCIQAGTFLAQALTSGDFGSFLASSLKSHTHSWSGTTSSSGAHTHSTTSAGGHTHGVYSGDAESGSTFGFKGTRASGVGGGDNLGTAGYTTTLAKNSTQIIQTAGAHTHTAQSAGAHTHTLSGTNGATGGSDTYPKHLRYPFFVVVSNVNAEEPSQADWDNFVGNLDEKLNKSLSNIDELGQAKFDAKVNKAGDTMTGQLTVIQNGNATIATKCADIAYTDTPTTSAGFGQFAVCDKNGDWIALYGAEMYNDGRNLAKMQVRANNGTHARIQIWADANNVFYCDFPKCGTKATTTSSASNYRVAVVVQNYVNGTSWYRVWSDGWIEQGGYSTTTMSNSGVSVSLLKAFSSTNYTVNATPLHLNPSTQIYTPTAWVASLATNKFQLYGQYWQNASVTGVISPIRWYACGY